MTKGEENDGNNQREKRNQARRLRTEEIDKGR